MASYATVKASVAQRVAWLRLLKAGRPCGECGVTLPPSQMHWHHRDPATKDFSLAQGAFRVGRARLLAEIAKCDLLCEDCHRQHHRAPCGTRSAYCAGCRCVECREANSSHQQQYRDSKRIS